VRTKRYFKRHYHQRRVEPAIRATAGWGPTQAAQSRGRHRSVLGLAADVRVLLIARALPPEPGSFFFFFLLFLLFLATRITTFPPPAWSAKC